MGNKEISSFRDSAEALAIAIHKLGLFNKWKEKRIRFKDAVRLAREKMDPFFSATVRLEEKERENETLASRDLVKCSVPLIQFFHEGGVGAAERSLALSALEVIQTYNSSLLKQRKGGSSKIWHPIELPISQLGYPLKPLHSAQKTFQDLGRFLSSSPSVFSPSKHKKGVQFLLDTFKLKSIRLFQGHFCEIQEIGEIFALLNSIPVEMRSEVDQEIKGQEIIHLRQEIEIDFGEKVILEATFLQGGIKSRTLAFPLLQNMQFTTKKFHSGFPSPVERLGMTLEPAFISAAPLRSEETPLFHGFEIRLRKKSEELLNDKKIREKLREERRLRRQIFNQNKDEWLALYGELASAVVENTATSENKCEQDVTRVINCFLSSVKEISSPFDFLAHIQKQILYLFIERPSLRLQQKAFQASWYLSEITPQKKYESSLQILQQEQVESLESLDLLHPVGEYVALIGNRLGNSVQNIILQYASEKMGFYPPKLSPFERRLQICAFQQILTFLNTSEAEIEQRMYKEIEEDLQVLRGHGVSQMLAWGLTQELGSYFIERSNMLLSRRG